MYCEAKINVFKKKKNVLVFKLVNPSLMTSQYAKRLNYQSLALASLRDNHAIIDLVPKFLRNFTKFYTSHRYKHIHGSPGKLFSLSCVKIA